MTTDKTTRRRFMKAAVAGVAAGATSTPAAADELETEPEFEYESIDGARYEECSTTRGDIVDTELMAAAVAELEDYHDGFTDEFEIDDVVAILIEVTEPIKLLVETPADIETVHPVGTPYDEDPVETVGMFYDNSTKDVLNVLTERDSETPTELVQSVRLTRGAPSEVSAIDPSKVFASSDRRNT